MDYSQTGNAFIRLNQAVSTIQVSNGPQDDQLVKNLGMRLERTFWSPAVWGQTGPGQYNFTAENPFPDAAPAPARDWGSDSPVLDNIIAQGAQPVICFSGEPGWDAPQDTESAELGGLPANMSTYQQLVRDGLSHLRSKYPGIRYIEVWNEPDNSLTSSQYETLYRTVSQAVQAVNAGMTGGELSFLVGGPAMYNPGGTMMADFISFVRANSLELDFLSWHEYGGSIWSDARTLQNKLSAAGLNPNMPQFVTEWGYTAYNSTSIPTPQTLMQSATYIAEGWTGLETNSLANIVTPFPFSQDDYAGYSRSMLVPYQENSADGQVFPLYNVYRMMALEKNTLVASSGISGGKSSLIPLATEDSSGVALMLTNTAGSTVTVNLYNLPTEFQGGAFQVAEYLVDGTHSNWAYQQSTSSLQEVAALTESAATSFSTTLTMAQDSVVLFVLTSPPPAGTGTAVRLAYLRQPSNASAKATMSPGVEVDIQDADGAVVTSATNPVTLRLQGGTGLGGTLTVAAQKGIATFSNLTVSTAGSGYTLLATSPKLRAKTSIDFNILTPAPPAGGTPVRLAYLRQPSNALAQATMQPGVEVDIQDANGVVVTSATNPVTLRLQGGTGLGGTLTIAAHNGIATFSNLTVSTAGSGYTLLATSPKLRAKTSATFTIKAAGP